MIAVSPASWSTSKASGASCAFKGCRGFLYSGTGPVGVVLCAPWGPEELVTRKAWRLMAEAIAGLGLPVLRFDYPGTGDSLGAMTAIDDVARWTQAIGAAADFLRAYSGVKRFVFIGQSLGATLAMAAAARRTDVVSLMLITPAVSGRAYLAEIARLAPSVYTSISGADTVLAGFSLSAPMVESLRGLDPLKGLPGGVETATIFDRADRKAGAEVSEHFKRHGAVATFEAIGPYGLDLFCSKAAQPLPAPCEEIIAALARIIPAPTSSTAARVPLLPATLRAETFREEPQRFGNDDDIHGMLCQPTAPNHDAPTFVLLNHGSAPRTGWGRSGVDQARALAAAGFASLRFDQAGVGDSPDRTESAAPGDPPIADIRAAVDRLVARGHGRIALVGRGSSAVLALAATQVDPRVSMVVAIDAPGFLWADEGLPEALPWGGPFGATLSALARRHLLDVKARLPLWLRTFILRDPLPVRVADLFKTLADQGTRVSLVYGDRDPGLSALRSFFGPLGRALRLPGCGIALMPNADDRLGARQATDWLSDHLIDLGAEGAGQDPQRSAA